jgi:hypothetical protein
MDAGDAGGSPATALAHSTWTPAGGCSALGLESPDPSAGLNLVGEARQARGTDATSLLACFTSTDELHERLYTPCGSYGLYCSASFTTWPWSTVIQNGMEPWRGRTAASVASDTGASVAA